MADERALDDNEKEPGTNDGASSKHSHHDDMLGHILEDISLDEWDVVDEAEDLTTGSSENHLQPQPANTAQTTAQPIAEPIPKPEAEATSLFSFAMMQQFEDDSEEPTAAIFKKAEIALPEPTTELNLPESKTEQAFSDSKTELALPESKTEQALPEPKTDLALPEPETDLALPEPKAVLPEPPKAVGPNPFQFPPVNQAPGTNSDTNPVTTAPTTPNPFTNLAASPITEPAINPNPVAAPNPVGSSPTSPNAGTNPEPAPVASPGESTTSIASPVPSPTPTAAPTSANPVTSQTANPSTIPAKAAPINAGTGEKGKRRPAATLIFDSFTKGQVGLDLLDLSRLPKPQTTTEVAPTNSNVASNATPPSPQNGASTQNAQPSKPRPTARTLIFRRGDSIDGMDPTFEQLMPAAPQRATTSGDQPGVGQNPTTATGSNPAMGQNPTTATGSNPTIGPNQTVASGTNPTFTPNSSVGPNLAAAIAAANPPGLQQSDDSAVARHNSNVIPAHQPNNPGGRQIARTMILKSLTPPAQHDYVEPVDEPLLEEPLTSTSQSPINLATGQDGEASAVEVRPKIAKRSTSPTLVFKAFTMPSVEHDAKPKPLKIIRYDSSKLRNMESNAKPLSIAESIAAAKQASIVAKENKDDRRPLWLKTLAAHPLAKSPMVRSGLLLAVLSIALLVCSSTLIKSLYTDSNNLHTSTVSAVGDQHHYKSVDGAKSLTISDKDTVLSINGKAIHGKMKGVSDADLLSLCMTPPAKREIWLQRTDSGYVDQDGTILYGASAPELQIARKLDTYAALLTAKFKESKIYPSDAERMEHISPKDFRYTNPFTGKADQPVVQYKRFAAADATWTDHTRQAHAWADEPPWKPGAIHCVCLDYCRFFIRGFDRNGQPLLSAPGVADYVELKDGKDMNPRRNDKIVDDKDRTPATFLVSRSSGLPLTVGVMRQTAPLLPIVLVVIVLACIGVILFLRRMKHSSADTVTNSTKFEMKE
ncbi:MAG: hypothetical protein U0103_11265 [Candidatus Obscuribacterales bacterium]